MIKSVLLALVLVHAANEFAARTRSRQKGPSGYGAWRKFLAVAIVAIWLAVQAGPVFYYGFEFIEILDRGLG